jgi:hypothetical protein
MAYNQPTGKFAMAQSYGAEYQLYVGDFNSTTGALSNVTIRETFTGGEYIAYGTEFSPSGNWLYNSIAANTVLAGAVRAYNMLTSTDIGNINGAGWPGLLYNGLKAGPDGRLWVNTNNYGSDPTPARVVRSTFDIENPVALGFVNFALPVNSFSYRFPDFLSLIPPPVAVDDQKVIINCTGITVSTNVLTNDTNTGSGSLFVDHIVDTPAHGTIQLTGNQVIYTLTDLNFVGTDTISYLIKSDVSCFAPGKISKLLVEVTQCPRDYGDAPNSYSTDIASDGATHNVVPGLNLGAIAPDIDTNGSTSGGSMGDDSVGVDDEDGIGSFPVIAGGTNYAISNYAVAVDVTNSIGTANLCGWIDWNTNGTFDTGEGVCTTVANGATSGTLTWPSATLSGANGTAGTYARFRITTDAMNSGTPNGVDSNGEVEDYFIPFQTPLPLTLVSFTAANSEQTSLLHWITASEHNSDRFEIQRCQDGNDWVVIGTVAAKGESSVNQSYHYTDRQPEQGVNLYRLKMIDKDGTFTYSFVRNVVLDAKADIKPYPYPSPAKDKLMIWNYDQVKEVALYNTSGQSVLSDTKFSTKYIDVSGLPQGAYTVKLTLLNGVSTRHKVVILR